MMVAVNSVCVFREAVKWKPDNFIDSKLFVALDVVCTLISLGKFCEKRYSREILRCFKTYVQTLHY